MHLQGDLCMGARLRVFLTHEQDQTLQNLRKQDVPQKVKDRAEVIRLNAHGWYVEKIFAPTYLVLLLSRGKIAFSKKP